MKEPNPNLLGIDLSRLEEECSEHSSLVYEWGKALAQARADTKTQKNKIKLLYCEIYQKASVNPQDYGLEKTTEKALEGAVLADEDYQSEQKVLIAVEYEEDILDAFVKALADRRTQLENEVKLFGQQYWSKPDTSGKEKQNREALSREASEELNTPKKKKKS